jgi:hypothetical protein
MQARIKMPYDFLTNRSKIPSKTEEDFIPVDEDMDDNT